MARKSCTPSPQFLLPTPDHGAIRALAPLLHNPFFVNPCLISPHFRGLFCRIISAVCGSFVFASQGFALGLWQQQQQQLLRLMQVHPPMTSSPPRGRQVQKKKSQQHVAEKKIENFIKARVEPDTPIVIPQGKQVTGIEHAAQVEMQEKQVVERVVPRQVQKISQQHVTEKKIDNCFKARVVPDAPIVFPQEKQAGVVEHAAREEKQELQKMQIDNISHEVKGPHVEVIKTPHSGVDPVGGPVVPFDAEGFRRSSAAQDSMRKLIVEASQVARPQANFTWKKLTKIIPEFKSIEILAEPARSYHDDLAKGNSPRDVFSHLVDMVTKVLDYRSS